MNDSDSLLRRFVRLYANSENLSSDIREIRMFQLWMEAAERYEPEQLKEDALRRTMSRTIKDNGR